MKNDEVVITDAIENEDPVVNNEVESSENAEVVVSETAATTAEESFGKRLAANLKERWRKFLVKLKRNPQRIPLMFFVIVSVIWLFWLFTFSQTSYTHSTIEFAGLAIFVNTLLSILLLALFLNAFPKRKKPNIVMIVLLFVFIAIMIAMDVVFYYQVYDFVYVKKLVDEAGLAREPFVPKSLAYAIAHIVLMGIGAIILALYPVYKKLLLKINTKKEVEDNNINEVIDVEDE